MQSMIYLGALAHLKGKTALTRTAKDGSLLAQFDDRQVTRSGGPIPQYLDYEPHARFPTLQDFDTPPSDALGFGWHPFTAAEFVEVGVQL